jgi:hypothetical protein
VDSQVFLTVHDWAEHAYHKLNFRAAVTDGVLGIVDVVGSFDPMIKSSRPSGHPERQRGRNNCRAQANPQLSSVYGYRIPMPARVLFQRFGT